MSGAGCLLPLSEVCRLLSVHERTVRRWIRGGDLRAYRLPGGWRVAEADLRHFLDRRSTAPSAEVDVDSSLSDQVFPKSS